MSLVYFALGTNLGNKETNLNKAIEELAVKVGPIVRQSSFYKSKPWGFLSENDFLNAVILVETQLSVFDLLEIIQKIELELGRNEKTNTTYTDRLIDIDILFYDNLIINHPILKIPHPLILERDFVYLPLLQIAPDLVHPVLDKKLIDLINL